MNRSNRARATRRVIFGVLIVLGAVLRLLHLGDVLVRTPDERTFVAYSARVAQGGPGAMRAVIAEFESNPQNWNYPAPVRVGHIFLVAAAMRLFDSDREYPAVALSWLCSVLSLILVARIGVRFFNSAVAMTAVFLLATSFEELALVRRAWQDATFGFFGLLLIYLALETMRAPGRVWFHSMFHAAGVLCLLMKPTGLILYGVAAVWLIAYLAIDRHAPRAAAWTAAAGITGLALAAATLAVLSGGADIAWSAYRHSFAIPPQALAYASSCCEGPWWQVAKTLELVNPLSCVLAAAGIVALVTFHSPSWRLIGLPALMLAVFTGFMSLQHYRQSLRYMSPVDGAFCLMAGYGLWRILMLCRRKLIGTERRTLYALAVSALIIAAVGEYRVFEIVSIGAATPDLGAAQIRQALNR